MFLRRLVAPAARAAAVLGVGASFLLVAPAHCDAASSLGIPTGLGSKHPNSVVTFPGAEKQDPKPSLTIEYWCLRALGELPRLILEATGTPYNSVFHFSGSNYKEYTPFGQLPVLRDGGFMLCESGAISRHLGRVTCIDGASLEEKAKVDMYYELAKDIKGKMAGVHDEAHADAKSLKTFLGHAEAACSGEHFVGGELTLADVAMFECLYQMEEIKPGCLSGFPKLSTFVQSFSSTPAIAAYLDSPRRVPLTKNELGKGRLPGMDGYVYVQPLKAATYATPWKGA